MTTSEKIARRVAERNSWATFSEPTLGMLTKMLWAAGDLNSRPPSQKELDRIFPLAKVDWETLRRPAPDKIQSTWIGHASLFVQMGGYNIMTDPVFSKRCSAVQFAGPKRYRDPPFTVQDICVNENVGVDVVLVSHNHYDHLDYYSVRELASTAIKTKRPVHFVVALGLKSWFEYHCPDSMKGGNTVTEIDWHETVTIGDKDGSKLGITGMPMQHWSSRKGSDRDKTLWCGFAVKSISNLETLNFLFCGDTGWFDGFHDIGKQYGPFDLAAIPIGAYAPRWFMKPMHTDPEDAVKTLEAVQAIKAFPIHWGTFPLTVEPVLEPRELLEKSMDAHGKDRSTFQATLIGETTFSS